MKRIISVLIMTGILLIPVFVFAFSSTPYGYFNYGQQIEVEGDFTYAGLSGTEQTTHITKNDMQIYDVTTGTPVEAGYHPEVMAFNVYDSQHIGEHSGRGYLLVPREETIIRYWVEQFNGNPDYILTGLERSESSLFRNAIYKIDGFLGEKEEWVNLASLLILSGGGGEVEPNHSYPRSDWKKYPTNEFDFDSKVRKNTPQITQFPVIHEFSLDTKDEQGNYIIHEGSTFTFDFTTYSVYNKRAYGEILINDSAGILVANELNIDSSPPYATTVKLQKRFNDFDADLTNYLKDGENTIKLRVRDNYYRYTETEIKAYYKKGINLKVEELWYSPDEVGIGEEVRLSVEVINQHDEEILTDLQLRVDGSVIETRPIHLLPNESKRSDVFTIIAPNKESFEVTFEVNPNKDKPSDEMIWEDNDISRIISIGKTNLKASDIWYSPSTVEPNRKVNTSVLVTNESNKPITTDVVFRVDGKNVETKQVTIPANSSVRTDDFTFTAPDKDKVTLEFEVNPNRNKPEQESSWEDNKITREMPIKNDVNLRIFFRNIPNAVDPQTTFSLDVVVANDSKQDITTDLRVQNRYVISRYECVEWEEDEEGNEICVAWDWVPHSYEQTRNHTITVPADGEQAVNVSGLYSGIRILPIDEGGTHAGIPDVKYQVTVSAYVNESRNPEEITYADNSISRSIYVNDLERPDYDLILTK